MFAREIGRRWWGTSPDGKQAREQRAVSWSAVKRWKKRRHNVFDGVLPGYRARRSTGSFVSPSDRKAATGSELTIGIYISAVSDIDTNRDSFVADFYVGLTRLQTRPIH